MSTLKKRPWQKLPWLVATATLCAAAGDKLEGPRLGTPAPVDLIKAWDISVFPNGAGLPPGRGTAVEGERIYAQQCAGCHGPRGIGASAAELAGGTVADLAGTQPDKTIGAYWPYATTVFDFVRRSMPLDAPRRFTDDEVYGVTAYLLHVNGLIDAYQVIDAVTLPRIKMPNRDGFIPMWPEPSPVR